MAHCGCGCMTAALVVVAAREKEEGAAGVGRAKGATLAAVEEREEERMQEWREA